MAGKSTTLVIRILADASQAARTMQGASGNAGKFAAGLNKATLPALAVVGALGAMGKAAAEDAHGQALLANSLRKNTGATAAQVAATEDWITKTSLATGIADDQLRPAMSTLTRATGDVTKSQKAMTTVMDVSAATGKDTQAVASAVAKAYAGNTGALGKLVPGLDKAVLKSGDMNKIMAELGKKTGGAAAAAADTATGKWKRSTVAFSEAKESIGAGLLPVMNKLTGMLATLGGWAARNTGAVTAFALALGILAGGILAVNAAMKVITAATRIWAAVQWALNSAFLANPIVWVIIAIVALVAILVIAYKKSATFRAVVQGAFKAVSAAAVVVKNALVAAWRAVVAGLSTAVRFIKAWVIDPIIAYFKLLWAAAQLMARLVKSAFGGLKSALRAVYDWIKGHVIDPLVAAFDKVVDAVDAVLDWISKIKLPKAVQKAIDWVTGGKSAPAPAAAPPPAPAIGRRGARGAGRAAPAASGGTPAALASLTAEPQVIVQVSDRKMAQLVDVSIRASATSAARDLTRRRVVTV